METIQTLKHMYSQFKTANTKEKIFLIAFATILIMTFGGLFLGILTGVHHESTHSTSPNPYCMVFGTTGFALAGALVVILSWRTDGWPMSFIGGIIFVVGFGGTMVTINQLFPFKFFLSTGTRMTDELLYGLITFAILCLSQEVRFHIQKKLSKQEVILNKS